MYTCVANLLQHWFTIINSVHTALLKSLLEKELENTIHIHTHPIHVKRIYWLPVHIYSTCINVTVPLKQTNKNKPQMDPEAVR